MLNIYHQTCMEPPTNKHRLRISHRIGKGAFGDVFKGTYDGEVVAVKTITNDVAGDAQHDACAMFKKEADVLSQCSHGRIIGYKALCRLNIDVKKHSSGGKWALVLEYAKGGTLSEKVVQCMTSAGSGKVYSNAQALSWALDVASALQYLHSKSPAVFHRDVKLGNVVLAKEDGDWVAKLSDFGLHVVADDKQQRLLRVSTIGGPGSASTTTYITHALNPSSITPAAVHPCSTSSPTESQQDTAAPVSRSCSGIADRSNHSTASLRSNEVTRRGSMSGGGWSVLTQQHLQQLQQQLAPSASTAAAAVNPHGPFCACCNQDSEQQLRTLSGNVVGCGHASCAAGEQVARARDMFYGEMHDSSGSVPYVVTPSAAVGGLSLVGAADSTGVNGAAGGSNVPGGQHKVPARRAASFHNTGTQQLADDTGRTKLGPRRTVSFQVAPPEQQQEQQQSGSRAAAAGAATVPTCRRRQFTADADLFDDDDDDDDACSIATAATWLSDATCATATTSATCSTEASGSIATEVELVYNMTGKTGSYMYMAPEVWENKPYNEKADVFSFGVVLYELMARCLLLFTELPTNSTDPAVTERYATKVSQGYRPSRPKRMPDGAWTLIEACWQQEPALRPSMSKVVSDLQLLLRHEGGNSRRSSFSMAAGDSLAKAGSVAASSVAGAASTAADQVSGQHTTAPAAPKAAASCGCTIS